jgi:predicted transcriptional regulator
MDVSTIAKHPELSEARVSEGVSALEKAGLIKVSYAPGRRGIRKLCEPAVQKAVVIIKS